MGLEFPISGDSYFSDIWGTKLLITNLLGKLLYKLFIEENADLIIEKVEEAVDDQYDRKLDFIDNFNKIVTTTESLIKFISVIGNIGMTVAPLVQ